MIRSIVSRSLVPIVLLLAVFLGVPAADVALAQAPSIPEITVEAFDYGYTVPAQVEAGIVAVNLTNTGEEPHHAQFMRLNDGVALEDFNEALQQGPEAALPLVTLVGGPATIAPGGAARVILDLQEGTHVIVCFVEDANGVPHLAHGMVQPFEVVAGSGEAAAPPEAAASVDMYDFGFTLPEEIEAGEQVWEITNSGPQPHEMNLVKLAPGKTMDDVAAYMESPEGPPPFMPVGGMQGLSNGLSGWVSLDLEPGTYVAVCFIPDPESGQPHIELGMVSAFTLDGAPETLPETGGSAPTGRAVAGWLLLTGLALFTIRGLLIRRRIRHG